MLLIPSIDLRGGRCVRLLKGDFLAETRYDLEPHELLVRYRSLGATWLHIVDLDGARDGTLGNRHAIVQLASQSAVKLQVGGGIRSLAIADDLVRCGVDRIVVGSAAVERPDEVTGWFARFGAERICLAFDVRADGSGIPRVHTRGWRDATELTLWQAVQQYVPAGLRHVLCTDIERDGAMTGPSVELYREAVRRFPQIDWQASGGVRSGTDLAVLAAIPVAAAVSGRALLEEKLAATEVAPYLPGGRQSAG